MLNELFEKQTMNGAAGNRTLPGTERLTAIAESIANDVMKAVRNDADLVPLVKASREDHDAMDQLIAQTVDISKADDYSFLKQLEYNELDGMLKSQQSKRSRCKSKSMTVANYKAMMIGAAAEGILRLVMNKPKQAGGRRTSGVVSYSEEELLELMENQEQLRREIRNLQSRKSIMKSKADFDVESDAWKSLLETEQQLKSIRVSSAMSVIYVDQVKTEICALLANVNIGDLKVDAAKQLLEDISQIVFSDDADEDKDVE